MGAPPLGDIGKKIELTWLSCSTSFDQHVVGGYKFLMRYYSPGDDIYMFGFSRGAYTARFLAEMLDHVGLVSQGNEEMVFFAWKTFSNWQARQENNKKQEMYKCVPPLPLRYIRLYRAWKEKLVNTEV